MYLVGPQQKESKRNCCFIRTTVDAIRSCLCFGSQPASLLACSFVRNKRQQHSQQCIIFTGSWRLVEGDTKDTLLTVLGGGPTAPRGLHTKELVIPTLRLIAACPDGEVRHSALEGFRNLVEVSEDSKRCMLSVSGWIDAVLDVLPRASGSFSAATTPTSSCLTHRSTRSAGGAPPPVDTTARKLLESLLTYSVLNLEQGAADVDSVTCGLRRMHANGELVGDSCLAWVLTSVVQVIISTHMCLFLLCIPHAC